MFSVKTQIQFADPTSLAKVFILSLYVDISSLAFQGDFGNLVSRSATSKSGANSVWQSITRWLPSQNEDCTFWWQTTGPHLGTLLSQAGYSIHQQYETLLFHYYLVVPRLGPRPTPLPSALPLWKSFMTDDFSPIEYSWKWDTGRELPTDRNSGPDIRYGIEAIGPYAGTPLDPLNQAFTKEILSQLDLAIPTIDLTWFHHLSETIFPAQELSITNKDSAKINGAGLGSSSMFLAFEFLKSELAAKAYFIPPGDRNEVQNRLLAAIRSLERLDAERAVGTQWAALDQTLSFMCSNDDGRSLSMFMIGIDCVEPSKSRLKIYVRTPKTSFDSVVNILTMCGKRAGFEKDLRDLKELWYMTLGLPIDFLTSEELPLREHATSGVCYYFDIQQATALPDIKMYIPVRHYGRSDMETARGLVEFLHLHGRERYSSGYLRALKELAPIDRLENSCGVQTYISCAFQKEGLSMTSYLSPNIYHGARKVDLLL